MVARGGGRMGRGRSSDHGKPAGTAAATGRRSVSAWMCSRGCCAIPGSRPPPGQVGLSRFEVKTWWDDSGTASMAQPGRAWDAIGDPSWAPELGRFNIEINNSRRGPPVR